MTFSTKSGIPWTLVFFRSFDNKTDAIKFENLIKRQKSRKFIAELIQPQNNDLPE